jgi:hypothetical protein
MWSESRKLHKTLYAPDALFWIVCPVDGGNPPPLQFFGCLLQSPIFAVGIVLHSRLMNKPVNYVCPDELYAVITGATSQDYAQVQASSKRLKELLVFVGTFDGLSEIAAQKNLPLQVRQQAIIQFKNNALNHWRSRKFVAITDAWLTLLIPKKHQAPFGRTQSANTGSMSNICQ